MTVHQEAHGPNSTSSTNPISTPVVSASNARFREPICWHIVVVPLLVMMLHVVTAIRMGGTVARVGPVVSSTALAAFVLWALSVIVLPRPTMPAAMLAMILAALAHWSFRGFPLAGAENYVADRSLYGPLTNLNHFSVVGRFLTAAAIFALVAIGFRSVTSELKSSDIARRPLSQRAIMSLMVLASFEMVFDRYCAQHWLCVEYTRDLCFLLAMSSFFSLPDALKSRRVLRVETLLVASCATFAWCLLRSLIAQWHVHGAFSGS